MARINTDLLRHRIGVAVQEGANPTDILKIADVSPHLLDGETPYVDAAVERSLWRAIVGARRDLAMQYLSEALCH